MTAALHRLAQAAGVPPRWRDVHGVEHEVSPETLRTVLGALESPAGSDAEIADSEAALREAAGRLPPLVTTTIGEPVRLPNAGRFKLVLETGGMSEGLAESGLLPGIAVPGYHRLELDTYATTLAVAPRRAYGIKDMMPAAGGAPLPWALAGQLYGLRRTGDGGLGDFQALAELVPTAARMGAAGIAISPVHAQFSADVNRFSPYAPSSRVAFNVLHAGIDLPRTEEAARLEALAEVDWPAASRLRLQALRAAFDAAGPGELAEFTRYRVESGSTLEAHARFEAIHARMFGADPSQWHWRTWPRELQSPASPDVEAFAQANPREVALHAYMQFRADRSMAAAQAACRAAGMPIGLIADLAVGADSGGSHCWSHPAEVLPGMTVGAPPDLLNAAGQTWGVTAFSPRGLRDHGYGAFLQMLRHAMRHAGGVRIDHALGLRRLWVVPDGCGAPEGAYISFPVDDLLRLIALESSRHRAVVLGEDLGTIPEGFQDKLAGAGVLGMRVLWFEEQHGQFTEPRSWSCTAAAMTSTHDLPTVAGWWSGRDLEWRARLRQAAEPDIETLDVDRRTREREALWAAMQRSGAAAGPIPDTGDTDAVADAGVRHLATAGSDLAILPLEDGLALVEQPNLPGTTDQHPNWRRRYPGHAAAMLDAPGVAARIAPLNDRTAPQAAPQTAAQTAPQTA